MAQLVEQRIRNAWVAGSSPAIGSLSMKSQDFHILTLFYSGKLLSCGISSVGRALASQAEGRGFESRIPLLKIEIIGEIKKVCEKFAGLK